MNIKNTQHFSKQHESSHIKGTDICVKSRKNYKQHQSEGTEINQFLLENLQQSGK